MIQGLGFSFRAEDSGFRIYTLRLQHKHRLCGWCFFVWAQGFWSGPGLAFALVFLYLKDGAPMGFWWKGVGQVGCSGK